MPNIDWNQAMAAAKGASFEPLPEADYDLVCVEATPTQSSTGKPMIKTKYQVESGPSAGKVVWNNYTFSAENDTALSIFFRHMAFHGLDASFFTAQPAWEQVAAALSGRRIRAHLGIREFQGVQRNELKNVMPASTPAPSIGAPGPAPAGPAPQVAQPYAYQTPTAPVQPIQQVPQPIQPMQPVQSPSPFAVTEPPAQVVQPQPIVEQPQPVQQVIEPQSQAQAQQPPSIEQLPQVPFAEQAPLPAAPPEPQPQPQPQPQEVEGPPQLPEVPA